MCHLSCNLAAYKKQGVKAVIVTTVEDHLTHTLEYASAYFQTNPCQCNNTNNFSFEGITEKDSLNLHIEKESGHA